MTRTTDPRDSALLARLVRELGLETRGITAGGPQTVPLSSRLRVGELAWCSVAVAGAALAFGSRSSPGTDPAPDLIAAAYRSERYLRIDDSAPEVWSPLSGFWRTSDGWVRTHANYPHHASSLRDALALPDDASADELTTVLGAMTASAATSRVTTTGGICVAVRPEDPRADAALRRHPLISLTRTADASRGGGLVDDAR